MNITDTIGNYRQITEQFTGYIVVFLTPKFEGRDLC